MTSQIGTETFAFQAQEVFQTSFSASTPMSTLVSPDNVADLGHARQEALQPCLIPRSRANLQKVGLLPSTWPIQPSDLAPVNLVAR